MTPQEFNQAFPQSASTDVRVIADEFNSAPPDFEIFFPMSKAVTDPKDGKVWFDGIASDQSPDLDGEIVKAASNPTGIEYLKKFGKVNWDHHPGVIGDVTEAEFITPEEAKDKYGLVVKGISVRLRGWVMPLHADPKDEDLREAHKMIKGGCKLGLSLQGHYARQRVVQDENGNHVTIAIPGFVHRVALCPQPKNSNSVCFVKSLTRVLSGEGVPAQHSDNGYSWPVVVCTNGKCEPLEKAISMDGSLAGDGTTGGNAIKLQSLAGPGDAKGGKKKTTCSCGGSHDDDEENDDDGSKEVLAALKGRKETRALRKSLFSLLDTVEAMACNKLLVR